MDSMIAWIFMIPAFASFFMVSWNALTWTRGQGAGVPRTPGRRVSVLIPARNEEANLAGCLQAVQNSAVPASEVLVYDDESTDATPHILRGLMREDPRLGTVEAQPLPAGWVGKVHACQRLAEQATGDILLFLDADVRLGPEGIARIAGLLDGADVVTAVPRQQMGSFFERLVMPLLHLTYMAWLPLFLIPRIQDPRVLAANGQILALRREAWERLDGFSAIRGAIVDDMALCRRAKSLGLRVVFADGHEMASCRMYQSARGVWEGFSKNLYLGLGASPGRLALVALLYATAFILPYGALILASPGSPWWVPAWTGVLANTGIRTLLRLRHGHPWSGVWWQPFAVASLLAIAGNSFLWSRARKVRWAGRTYQEAEA